MKKKLIIVLILLGIFLSIVLLFLNINKNNVIIRATKSLFYAELSFRDYNKKDYDNAIKNLTKAIEQTPEVAQLYGRRAGHYADIEKFDEAIKDCNNAIKLSKSSADKSLAYALRGSIYIDLKDYNSAIDDLTKAIELDPYNKDAYFRRGILYSRINKFEEAIKDWNKALEIDPNYDEVKKILEIINKSGKQTLGSKSGTA